VKFILGPESSKFKYCTTLTGKRSALPKLQYQGTTDTNWTGLLTLYLIALYCYYATTIERCCSVTKPFSITASEAWVSMYHNTSV